MFSEQPILIKGKTGNQIVDELSETKREELAGLADAKFNSSDVTRAGSAFDVIGSGTLLVVGASGSGKTTFNRVLTDYLAPPPISLNHVLLPLCISATVNMVGLPGSYVHRANRFTFIHRMCSDDVVKTYNDNGYGPVLAAWFLEHKQILTYLAKSDVLGKGLSQTVLSLYDETLFNESPYKRSKPREMEDVLRVSGSDVKITEVADTCEDKVQEVTTLSYQLSDPGVLYKQGFENVSDLPINEGFIEYGVTIPLNAQFDEVAQVIVDILSLGTTVVPVEIYLSLWRVEKLRAWFEMVLTPKGKVVITYEKMEAIHLSYYAKYVGLQFTGIDVFFGGGGLTVTTYINDRAVSSFPMHCKQQAFGVLFFMAQAALLSISPIKETLCNAVMKTLGAETSHIFRMGLASNVIGFLNFLRWFTNALKGTCLAEFRDMAGKSADASEFSSMLQLLRGDSAIVANVEAEAGKVVEPRVRYDAEKFTIVPISW